MYILHGASQLEHIPKLSFCITVADEKEITITLYFAQNLYLKKKKNIANVFFLRVGGKGGWGKRADGLARRGGGEEEFTSQIYKNTIGYSLS